MARRPTRSLAALLIAALALAGCTDPASDATTSETSTVAPVPPTISTSIRATIAASAVAEATTVPRDIDAQVTVPNGPGPFPVVVLVHGGGWVTGDPTIMDPLARHLNANGYLTINTRYALSTSRRAGFPASVDDVACAVRLGREHPDGDGTVTVIGHSAGAHIGAIVALSGTSYGADCRYPGTGTPDRFVGLAGPYDVSRLGPAMGSFFGGGPDQVPEAWEAGNPQLLTDRNPDLQSLIMHGSDDGLVPQGFALDFYEALVLSGSEAHLEIVEGARHNDMHDPDQIGDLIVTWLER